MPFKKWDVGTPDRELAKEIAEELDIDPFTALIANSRGIDDLSEFEYFLSNEPIMSSPFSFADMKRAADCINETVEAGLKIAVFGDYDCDGVMATAIMYKYLVSRNADVITYIPDRITEGYGMNREAVDYLSDNDVKLIITVDNGVACIDEVDYASSKGIVTVVSDHHLPGDKLPDACAVVDPHRADCGSSFKEICGAQVAFYLVCATENKEPEEMLPLFADLLSVAVVGDFMPMKGENRAVVRYGIEMIKKNSNMGLSTVLSVAGIDRDCLDSSKLSYGIVPRINAAGRMGSAKSAFNLVTENNINTVLSIANEIEAYNASRQKTEKEILREVLSVIGENGYNHDRVIVVSGEGYHQGVVGIVAARICEKYGRPTIVLSSDGDVAHGSGRSIKGFNIFEAISSASEHLIKFGGHELAAGVSVNTDKIDDFRKAINSYALGVSPAVPAINLDFRINPAAMSVDMVDAIRSLEPFGNENPLPVFGVFSAKLEKITPIGQGKHLRLLFSKGGVSFQGLLFGTTLKDFCFDIGDILDTAVTLDKNEYRNEMTLSVVIKALRMSGTDDDKLFEDIFAVDDYLSFKSVNKKVLLPQREEIGTIYNYIGKNEATTEKLLYKFINSIGYAKAYISVMILKELGLVRENDGILCFADTKKTDLTNSDTFKTLSQGG